VTFLLPAQVRFGELQTFRGLVERRVACDGHAEET
jgi:hypothetical protein